MKPVDQLTDAEFNQHMHRAVTALPDAPLSLQQAAIALWPASGPVVAFKAAAQTVLRQINAVLSFDSWAVAPQLAHGMRSPRSATRHMLFSAQGRDVDLRVSPLAHSFSLAGQILGPDEAGQVELTRLASPAAPTQHASLDALGEFRIDGLERGPYRLTLQLGDDEIVLPPIDVGE